MSSPAGPLRGEARVPGDKSVSHRAVMLASLAVGTSHITGFLDGELAFGEIEARLKERKRARTKLTTAYRKMRADNPDAEAAN